MSSYPPSVGCLEDKMKVAAHSHLRYKQDLYELELLEPDVPCWELLVVVLWTPVRLWVSIIGPCLRLTTYAENTCTRTRPPRLHAFEEHSPPLDRRVGTCSYQNILDLRGTRHFGVEINHAVDKSRTWLWSSVVQRILLVVKSSHVVDRTRSVEVDGS